VIENLVIFGCGTSLYAGQYAAVFYKKLAIFNTVTCIEASDFEEHDLPADKAGAIFIS
jgi:fructoselysine-6-P-deglycase FrlB-like protein